ncbi:MAG: hypothetical protein ABI454_02915, partial [Sphingomicrobium sp.]
EDERESITQTRVRLYNKALTQLREENERKEAEARSAKEPDAEAENGPDGSGSDRADTTTHKGSDKAS